MAELKTQITDVDPLAFIAAVEPASKRADAEVLDAMFRRVTGEQPRMWGPAIIGYGSYHYRYASGHEGVACRAGFSPRKAKHSLYLMGGCCAPDMDGRRREQLARLGKHRSGASCLYINKLADVNLRVLEEMIAEEWAAMAKIYPEG